MTFKQKLKQKRQSKWFKLKVFLTKNRYTSQKWKNIILISTFSIINVYILTNIAFQVIETGIFEPKIVTIVVAKESDKVVDATIDPMQEVNELAESIYKLESSGGKHNFSKCASIDKVNSVGFGIYNEKHICFTSHEEEMTVVKGWIIDKKSRGLSNSQLLCLYNTGKSTDDCAYLKNYKLLQK